MSVHGRRRVAAALAAVILIAVAVLGATLAGGSGAHPSGDRLGMPVTGLAGGGDPSSRPAHRSFHPVPAAATLAAQLTLPQQVAQLFIVSIDGTDAPAAAALAPAGAGGVVLTGANVLSDGQIAALAADVAGTVRASGAPSPLIAATQEGGRQTAIRDLPPEGQAKIGAGADLATDAATARAQALLAAQKLAALGINMTIAPLADVDTPNGPLTGRLFSANPQVVARLASAASAGYAAGKLIDAVGHFPGTGAASADPDEITANVGGSLSQLQSRDLVPFAAIADRAPVIEMSNAIYTAFDGVTPASLLPQAVDLLRRTYGFIRVVMTDDLDATLNPTGERPGQVALQALEAGDDLLYITGPPSEHLAAYDGVLSAAEHNPRVRELVHTALLHDLTLKADYHLLG